VNADEFWVCWSPGKEDIRVMGAAESIEENIIAVLRGEHLDYIPLARFSSAARAGKFAEAVRNLRCGDLEHGA